MDGRPSTRSSDLGLLDSSHEKGPRQLADEPTLDDAFRFIQLVDANIAYQPPHVVKLKSVGVKVDAVLLPILFANCLVQSIITYVFQHPTHIGILEDLNISGAEYASTSTFDSVTFLVGNLVSAFVLIKIQPVTWLALNVILNGVSVACLGDTQNYTTLLISRVIAGLLTAATLPCLTLVTSQWYHKKEQPLRFCLWGSGIAIAQLVGPLLCFGFHQVRSAVFPGWRLIFVVLGCCTVVIGLLTLVIHMNDPMTAAGRWLTHQESATLLDYVSSNRTTIRNTSFTSSHIKALIKDPQVYLLMVLLLSVSLAGCLSEATTSAALEYTAPNDFEHAALEAASGFFGVAVTLSAGFLLQYTSLYRVLPLICILLFVCIGSGILAFVRPTIQEVDEVSTFAYVIASLTDLTAPATVLILSYAAANIAGATKRAISICLISSSLPLASLITSFVIRQPPVSLDRLRLATYLDFGSSIVALSTLSLLLGWYVLANSRKERFREANSRRELDFGIAIVRTRGDEWKNRTDEADEFTYLY